MTSETRTVISNARLLDVDAGDYLTGATVVIDDGQILDVSPETTPRADRTIDARDRVVMPGLIDAHVHPLLGSMDVASLADDHRSYLWIRAANALERILQRGFTTVRDACGGDAGLVRATDAGLIVGPRLKVSGLALSQSGGHGDVRRGAVPCACGQVGVFSRIADGVDGVRRAAREELRAGADQLKIMASGGVASPTDEIWTLQYTVEEMAAAVEEAASHRSYVLAHAYTSEAIRRAVEAGVRSIEHGNLLDRPTAALMAQEGVFLVPTLVAYEKIRDRGAELGMPENQRRKVMDVIDQGLQAITYAREAGVKVGFGSDLLGPAQVHQNEEFAIRARVEDPIDTIRSATRINAELLGVADQTGAVRPGLSADLVIVDGDPLDDGSVLADPARIDGVLCRGELVRTDGL